jgi:hypothetical protein
VVVLFAVYLCIVIALPLTLGLAISYRNLCRNRHCPQCGNETLRLRSPWTRVFEKIAFADCLQRRWCATCDWEGFSRVDPIAVPAPVRVVERSSYPAGRCRTEPVRTLHFGGLQWRVLLQYWAAGDDFCGQLIFVGPAGSVRRDPNHSFTGKSRVAVVEQALSLSDGLLTYRLRELASD